MQKELHEYLGQQLAPALELLKQMVAINSFTTNKDGVDALGRFTADAFAPLGFTADFVPSVRSDYGSHLVLTRRGRTDKIVGLVTHLDTVFPPEEEQRNNFAWRPEGDRIYGPGTMDIKGGTMMIFMVLQALRQFAPKAFEDATWVILSNSSEEVLSLDFGRLCLDRLKGNCLAALVFEAGARNQSAFSLVTARKGRAVFRVVVEGRGAHAGAHHERGANAIVQLADIIHGISGLTDYSKELTFNVGTISGGTVINRVPHQAVAEGEMRCFSMDIFHDGIEKLMALKKEITVRAADDKHPCQVSIEIVSISPPWPRNDGTEKLFKMWQQTAGKVGLSLVREERGGISDGNFICHAVPTIDGLGPNGDNAHCSEQSNDGTKQQEFLEVSSVIPKAALTTLGIMDLVG